MEVPIVSVCQSGCLHCFFFFSFAPFDETVTVKLPVLEGTSFGSIWPVDDLRDTESSVSWISGYSIPLPPAPRKRLIRGTLADIKERLATALETVSFERHRLD
jgi:hypothetical protein